MVSTWWNTTSLTVLFRYFPRLSHINDSDCRALPSKESDSTVATPHSFESVACSKLRAITQVHKVSLSITSVDMKYRLSHWCRLQSSPLQSVTTVPLLYLYKVAISLLHKLRTIRLHMFLGIWSSDKFTR